MKTKTSLILLILLFLLTACAQGTTELKPPEIRYGEDVCVECNMIISDPRFATAYAYEVSPGRYQSALFDDVGDMLIYADKNPGHKVVAWYVHDYETKEWTDATAASYLVSGQVETPMASGIVSFASRDRADVMAYSLGTEVMDWNTLQAKYKAGEIGVGMAGAAVTMGEQMHAAGSDESQESMAGHEEMQAQEIVLGEAEVAGASLQLVVHEPLHTGYNAVMVHAIGSDGQALTGAQMTYQPMMAMVDGKDHSAGAEQPVEEQPGMYHGAVAFPMPSGADLGTWALTVSMTDTVSGTSGETTFPVEVAPAKLAGSLVGPDDSKIFLMVVQPAAQPAVGKQPFEVYAMTRQGMMDWPPLDDLTLEITPEMPTMGHGSPGNVNPTSQGNGHYLGSVNFTMPGPWTVTLAARRGEVELGEVEFEFAVR